MSTKKEKLSVLEEAVKAEETKVEEPAKLQAAEPLKEEPKKAAETVIYTGESLPGGSLQQFSIFKNGLPKDLEEHIEKCPAIKELMVPLASLAETRINLLVQGSRENTLNRQVQSYIRGNN
ncbi:hypothetical protein [Bacillus infantis]|uniref:hypothetical protein n=1 Tax=Bacillus infantis TaxID=324767 RepID=UPI0032192EC7